MIISFMINDAILTREWPKAGGGWQHKEEDNDEHAGRGIVDCVRLLRHLCVVAVGSAVPVYELVHFFS